MLDIRAVAKRFPGSDGFALHPTDLAVADNELLVLLGSSGSGKTTLLKLINGLLQPSAGQIFFKQKATQDYDPVTLKHSIGYVFQGGGLMPHFSVAANISIVPQLQGHDRQHCQALARQQLQLVDMDPDQYAHRLPHELSGGQQQRVGVARALATGADLLLMDEPFGALDAITRDQLQQELLRLKQQLGKTIIFVTHDIFEALTLADRIAVMHAGRLQQIGSAADIINHPATAFVQQLLQKPLEQLGKLQQHA